MNYTITIFTKSSAVFTQNLLFEISFFFYFVCPKDCPTVIDRNFEFLELNTEISENVFVKAAF